MTDSIKRAFIFKERADITDTLDAGEIALYANSGALKIKIGNIIRTLDIGLTVEEVQDLLQSSFEDTASIKWVYDDNANVFRANLDTALLSKVNSALQAGNNISLLNNNLGFETPAQLSARDSANRQRANHTGTQLASTISDLDQAIANYLDRKTPVQIPYAPASFSVNTTTTPLVIVDQNYTPLHTGKYKVHVSFGQSYDDINNDNQIELLLDNTIVKRTKKKPADTDGGTNPDAGASGTTQNEDSSFTYIFDAVASTPFNIKFQHYADDNGVESAIKGLDLYVERYL